MDNSDKMADAAVVAEPGTTALTVLLVEDGATIAASVVDALSRNGLSTRWCADAETAEVALERGDYRVCLVDRALSNIDGLTFIERLRKKRPKMGVIAVSALGGLDDRIHGCEPAPTTIWPSPSR